MKKQVYHLSNPVLTLQSGFDDPILTQSGFDRRRIPVLTQSGFDAIRFCSPVLTVGRMIEVDDAVTVTVRSRS
jgi:hypothetical protein